MSAPTALIAEDEPLLRDALAAQLKALWPGLILQAAVRNGREAVEAFEKLRPDICFLDIQMPGMSGLEAAALIGNRAHLVFVTAFDQYAVKAFQVNAVDYVLKPVDPARLAETIDRLKQRLQQNTPAVDLAALLGSLQPDRRLRWLSASVGSTLKLIDVDHIDYLRADAKYTVVAWRSPAGECSEAVVRTPLKSLLGQLDSERFVQVHRSVVVQLRAISHLVRGDNETATLHLNHREETLPVSRRYLAQFRAM